MNLVHFNGAFAEGTIRLPANDRGLLLGDGIFETMMVVNCCVLWRAEHLARMKAAAEALGLPFDADAVDNAVEAVLGRAAKSNNVLRVTLTRGGAVRGLAGNGTPNLLVTLDPLPSGFMLQPAKLATSTIRRNEWSPASQWKTLSYVDAVAAAREAVAKGADDALMLNTQRFAASSTISNLFVVKGEELATPSLDQGILPGITRKAVLAMADSLGLKAAERKVEVPELHGADAVFLTNSLRFIRPVPSLDGRALGTRDLKPLIDHLALLAGQQCGRDPRLI